MKQLTKVERCIVRAWSLETKPKYRRRWIEAAMALKEREKTCEFCKRKGR